MQKGRKVTKLHQVVEYSPKRCFRHFVQEVSNARQVGDADSAQKIIADTMMLIGNSGYSSLIMDKEKHWDTMLTQGRGASQLNIIDQRFKKCAVISENLHEKEMAEAKICFDLPIQFGYHILQLAKLWMLQFRYDCLENYCDMKDFEYLEMNTDSAYFSLAGKQLEDIIKPEGKQSLHHEKMEQCHDFNYQSDDGFFPPECCKKHKAYDKRTPGLFKVEAQGKAIIALCSKTYILKKHDDKVKFSCKGLNKSVLKEPFPSYKEVLKTGETNRQPTKDLKHETKQSSHTNSPKGVCPTFSDGGWYSHQASKHYFITLAQTSGGTRRRDSSMESGKHATVCHWKRRVWAFSSWCLCRCLPTNWHKTLHTICPLSTP